MASPLDVQELVGDETAEARAWLRNIKKYIAAQTVNTPATRLDSAAAALFGVHIAEGSTAQTWFNGLTVAQRTSYANLTREFDTRWPPIPATPTPLRQILEEFDGYVLTAGDIGQRIPTGHGNATDWAHKVFAQRLLTLGTRTTLPDAALVMRAMDKHIPPAVRELMQPHASRSWRDCAASLPVPGPAPSAGS
ncbi:hypothetical protein EXIGLDRAFT_709010 [Exidia glandulosa HHB12029]|uniref:Uncharacterized protein n=1 Tax=Exidia glandulosa HHB12029 TaxID=1314781 RepID=A0A166MZU8_EXIGL|nr:hypothetical protein EXIGLDRAFT_709010 [Exidia glandulosa HHB12029]